MAKKKRDKTPRVKTRRKHRQSTQKALAVPVAQFLVEILAMRKRFSIVSVKKGKNSTFSPVDLCLGILAIIMLECDRFSHLNTEYQKERLLAHQLGLVRMFEQSTAHLPTAGRSLPPSLPRLAYQPARADQCAPAQRPWSVFQRTDQSG